MGCLEQFLRQLGDVTLLLLVGHRFKFCLARHLLAPRVRPLRSRQVPLVRDRRSNSAPEHAARRDRSRQLSTALTLLRACCRRWKQQQRRRASESERRATVERAVWRELWERSHFERAGEGVRTALLRGRSSSSEEELLTSRPETPLLGPSPVHERQCSRTGAARPSPQPAWQWRQ